MKRIGYALWFVVCVGFGLLASALQVYVGLWTLRAMGLEP